MHNKIYPSIKTYIKKAVNGISDITIRLLNVLLFPITAVFIWFIISFFRALFFDPIGAYYLYEPMIEYIMMSLLLAISAAAVLDISIRNDGPK